MTAPAEARASHLSSEQLAQLREQANKEGSGPFVDPRRMRVIQDWWRYDLHEWAEAILGHEVTDLRYLPWLEWVLLDLAHQAEPNPPPAPKLTARIAASRTADELRHREEVARYQAKAAAWASLRAALPVPVVVVHNYSSARHCESGYVQGVEHILVTEDLRVGRLYRVRGRALCFTPGKSHDQRAMGLHHCDPTRDDRLPTCKACIRVAQRISNAPAAPTNHKY